MKLCKDCKFFEAATGKCLHESAIIHDYVNGNDRRYDAQIHRTWNLSKDCGKNAKFFDPAEAVS